MVCDGNPFEGLTKLNKTLDLDSVKLLSPVAPPNIICVGLNYKRHADEGKQPYPDSPWLFMKPTTTVCGLGDPIVLPLHNPDRIDYEIELAIVIGKQAKNVPEDKVLDYVLGYTVANDVSNRAAQRSDPCSTAAGPAWREAMQCHKCAIIAYMSPLRGEFALASAFMRTPSQLSEPHQQAH